MPSEFSTVQLDALKEVINIGGGNAATSLSQLINKPVHMTVPTIEVMAYEDMFEQVMSEDTMIDAVLTKMFGQAEGVFLLVGLEEDMKHLASIMLPENSETNPEMIDSALKELANILVNSFLNAVTKLLDINLLTSIPLLTRDMFGAIVSSVYMESGQYDDTILILKNEFYYMGERMEAALYFVPTPGVLDKLFSVLGV
ncbi:MAG: chemotaxis protein CheC [Desemzia incerta]|uniref:chemotaxis protein CheC n=1 Tax=Desemzia TaxID=82800 RepID=UPI001E51CBD8|nr:MULTISPECIES: chemotaxis protein CheC [Desemzia]MCI3028115.1 chemotaxis protein CheC [Desemzia sp. C1]WHZ32362.1 chemotaxis protein CheC [Desemzia incerta]